MTEYALFALIRKHLLAGLADNSLPNVKVVRSYQQLKAATPDTAAIIIHSIGTTRAGWQSRKVVREDGQSVSVSEQNHIKNFQLNALVPLPDPANETVNTLTAGDLLDIAAMLLQNGEMVKLCRDNGLGIERISAITANYVQDENDNWQYEPSFDLAVAVKKSLSHSVGVVTSTDIKIYPV